MVVDKKKKSLQQVQGRLVEHRHFYNIIEYLQKGDLLVWNNSKVFKARLFGQLVSKDGKLLREHKKPVEIFLVRPSANVGVWQALAKPGRHVENGMRVEFVQKDEIQRDKIEIDGDNGQKKFYCDVIAKREDGTLLVQFPFSEEVVRRKANTYGHVPVPPYIKDEPREFERYQTVYAKYEGSVAAPTAGFHFTPELIAKLKDKGVEFAEVTLHVGLGTFLPVKTERVEDHLMHSEWVELTAENAEKINSAKREGRRVIAVGTTTVRTLEGIAASFLPLSGVVRGGLEMQRLITTRPLLTSPDRGGNILRPYSGEINLFITPGFQFRVVDALITNFHLPKSTLLMLVSAFVGDTEFVLSCYEEAIRQNYRFYSFGDAMFIQ